MKQYFLLQLKRVLKTAPALLALSLTLAVGFGLILNLVASTNSASSSNKATVAITGELEDTFLSMGISALSNFDALSYSIEVIQTDEESARALLEKGQISAYVVIPDGFAEKAAWGEFLTIDFVTTPGATGLIPMIKQEITQVISAILTGSHKGVYGVADALRAEGQTVTSDTLNAVAFDYVEFILMRSKVYNIENLGVAYSLTFSGYFFCGLLTVLLFLLGIAGSHIFVRKDSSLCRLLKARGLSGWRQLAGEFGAYFIMLWGILALIILAAYFSGVLARDLPVTADFGLLNVVWVLIKLIPAMLLICAFHFAVFEISTEPVSAVLFQFLFAVILGYASGCIFPIWFFPDILQRLAPFTPTGAARGYIAACFNGENTLFYLALTLGFAALFGLVALLGRKQRILGKKEGAI